MINVHTAHYQCGTIYITIVYYIYMDVYTRIQIEITHEHELGTFHYYMTFVVHEEKNVYIL